MSPEEQRTGPRGTLYALGLGPGDPKLITVAAAELLAGVKIVAFPADPGGDPGRAYAIAHPYLSSECEEIRLTLPMTGDRRVLERAWDEAVARLEAATATGRDVAYLCLGDSLLYGSFGYLLARYDGPVHVVPGVISPVAAAAALGLPLVEDREPLVILPDGADVDRLRAALALDGSVVVMKPSRLTGEAVALLEETGASGRALVVQEVTREGERVFRAREADLSRLPYFSLVVVPPAHRSSSISRSKA